ncbi:MAG: hypothetical protein F6K41_13800 [Symploca sp. SIO3E6]|nr:hypothetical protein [Caldora sp. SIO3E6]
MKKFFFITMHENPSLRVPASPRPRVSFKSEGRGQKVRKKFAREKGIISDYPNLISVGLEEIPN